MRRAIGLALEHAMEADPRVFLLGEDIADPLGGSFRVTLGLSSRFGPERVRNTPISESAIVGAAVGAALAGMRPVAEIMYVDFLALAMDQLVNQAAFLRYISGGAASVPLVLRCQGGAGGSQGAQHSKSLEAWVAHVPGLRVVVPSTPQDAYWLLRAAIGGDDPVVFVEPSSLYRTRGVLDVAHPPEDIAIAARRRAGQVATIATWGAAVPLVLEAAEALAADGIETDVLDLRHLAPLAFDTVAESVRRTGLLAIVHEAWEAMGPGAEIAARAAAELFDVLEGPVLRVGALGVPHPFSPTLERAMLPDAARVVATIRSWFERD